MLNRGSTVFVAGHRGMVGSALVNTLADAGFENLITASRSELDLCRQQETEAFLEKNKPEGVVVAAARVGGIEANRSFPADFGYDNLMMAANLVEAAYRTGVKRLLFLGSSCIYPKFAEQPIREEALLTGALEPTNEAYAVAKIAGLKLCEYYRRQHGCLFHSAMPCNLYGPGDNYHPDHSHVIPGLIRRFHEAKESGAAEVILWGTGRPRREFLHVQDLAAACLHLLDQEDPPDLVNVGAGEDLTIRELAEAIARVVGFEGELIQDTSKPDGTPRKLMDSSRIRELGWRPKIPLREGLQSAYEDFLERMADGTVREK